TLSPQLDPDFNNPANAFVAFDSMGVNEPFLNELSPISSPFMSPKMLAFEHTTGSGPCDPLTVLGLGVGGLAIQELDMGGFTDIDQSWFEQVPALVEVVLDVQKLLDGKFFSFF